MTQFTDAMIAQIERNDILVRVAKLIDPGAFSEWWNGTGPDAKKHDPDVRQRHAQASALNLAGEILIMLAREPDWQKQAAAAEADGWRDLGVPIDLPELRKIIDKKYDYETFKKVI